MRNPRTLLIAVGALALFVFGFFFVRSPKPIIEIKGEELAKIGPLPILNTYITSIVVIIVIIAIAYLGTRKLNLIPSGLQNAVEGVAEVLYNMCVQTAGEKNARRFFPMAATLFVFIWIANWMALTPIFNSIGQIETVDAHHFHEEAHIFDDVGGIGMVLPFKLGGDSPEVEFEVDVTTVDEIGSEMDLAKEEGAPAAEIEALELVQEEALAHAREEAIVEALHEGGYVPEDISSYEDSIAYLEADGKQLGLLFPWFRSVNTDLNSPLSLAIMSMIFIEFWGITALGVFKYGGKFINFSSPLNFVVGLLELVTELARIISFTFRLFGNMLAGEILLVVMTFLIPFMVASIFYGLETFVGVVQAFVFFILTVAFGALACAEHGEHDGEAEGEHGLVSAEYGADSLVPPTI